MKKTDPIGQLARRYGRALVSRNRRLVTAPTGLDNAIWAEFQRRINEPAIALQIAAGGIDVGARDVEPEHPAPIDMQNAARMLGFSMPVGDDSVIQIIAATAPLAARSNLAGALLHDQAVRAKFLTEFARTRRDRAPL